MPRSKTKLSKLPRDLRDPIQIGRPLLSLTDAELQAWWQERNIFVVREQMRKLGLLMKELNTPDVEDDPLLRWIWLSLELAKKLYPGFLTEAEAKPQGRQRGTGAFSDRGIALIFVDVLRKHGIVRTDEEAARLLLVCENEELGRPGKGTQLDQKASTFVSAVSRERAKRRKASKASSLQ